MVSENRSQIMVAFPGLIMTVYRRIPSKKKNVVFPRWDSTGLPFTRCDKNINHKPWHTFLELFDQVLMKFVVGGSAFLVYLSQPTCLVDRCFAVMFSWHIERPSTKKGNMFWLLLVHKINTIQILC
jgi:hypothetical protein